MKDLIIVGGGIAGTTLAWQWFLRGKSIHWIADDKESSSHVAAGVFNPVVLKRFSPVWKAEEQLDMVFPFYNQVKDYLKLSVIELLPIWRRFHDAKERATWIRKSSREDLDNLMGSLPVDESIHGITAVNGYGLLHHTGWLNTLNYLSQSMLFFDKRNEFHKAAFDYGLLKIKDKEVKYSGVKARSIIFAEGNYIPNNPWFRNLPLQGNKGEILIIKCPGLQLDQIIKSSVFLMPYKEDLFWVGATYDRDYVDTSASTEARAFLISKLNSFLNLPYDIVDQKSGIRPTTMDRRPFVGRHPEYKNLFVFNGMGSRASLIAPWASRQLFDHIYNDAELPEEMDVKRFR